VCERERERKMTGVCVRMCVYARNSAGGRAREWGIMGNYRDL